MKLKLVIFLLLTTPLFVFSQTEESTIFDEATIVYNNAVYGGAILHTNGWGAHLTFAKAKTAFKFRTLQFDLVLMKHPKEVKSYTAYEQSQSYIFGKINSFFVLRPSLGRRVVSFDKIRKSGVSVGYSWRAGPSLGFTKPVYLQIRQREDNFTRIVVEPYDPDVPQNDIAGRAGFLKGFNQLKLHPGIYGAVAVNFEYDADREGLKGIEVGATVDYFPIEEIDIMAYAKNYRVFFNFYVCLQFGKKFNK